MKKAPVSKSNEAQEARRAREAEALRANLRKRKDQQRAREAAPRPDDGPSEDPPSEHAPSEHAPSGRAG
jgi:hypothetical protein